MNLAPGMRAVVAFSAPCCGYRRLNGTEVVIINLFNAPAGWYCYRCGKSVAGKPGATVRTDDGPCNIDARRLVPIPPDKLREMFLAEAIREKARSRA